MLEEELQGGLELGEVEVEGLFLFYFTSLISQLMHIRPDRLEEDWISFQSHTYRQQLLQHLRRRHLLISVTILAMMIPHKCYRNQ